MRCACGILKSWDVFILRHGRAWKKRARRTASVSLPLWARIPRFYIWNNELERAKDAICERPLNLYVCRRGALWLAYHRTQTQSATQWEFVFNPSTDIDSYYSYDTRTRQKCFIRTGYSFQPSIRLNSSNYSVLLRVQTELRRYYRVVPIHIKSFRTKCWYPRTRLGTSSWFRNELLVWERAPGLGTSSWFGNELLVWERAPGLGTSSWFGNELLV